MLSLPGPFSFLSNLDQRFFRLIHQNTEIWLSVCRKIFDKTNDYLLFVPNLKMLVPNLNQVWLKFGTNLAQKIYIEQLLNSKSANYAKLF